MKLDILKLIIWPKDSRKLPRVLNFKPNSINLITGTSKTGKTAIIEIIDYCLGSRGCSIPKIGPIRESSSWYGILVDTIEGEKLIARRDPGNKDSTDDYYLTEGKNIRIVDFPKKNTNREAIRNLLSRLAKLPQVNSDFHDTGNGFKGRASFRDTTAFIFQPQTIIASNSTLFFKADDEVHARKLREIFPLILGAVDSDTLIKQHRLYEVKRILERKRRQLETLRQATEDFKGEVRGRYIAAVELGLINGNISSLDDTDIEVFIQKLKDVLSKWDNGKSDKEDSNLSFIGSERLSVLRKRESKLLAEQSALKIRLTQLRELSMARRSMESNLLRERDRLSTMSWLSEKLNEPHKCPLCGSFAESFSEELDRLKETTSEVEALWNGIHIVPPMLDAEEVEIRKAIQKNDYMLKQIELEIKQIEQQNGLNQDKRNQKAMFIGRLVEFFETYKYINQDGNLIEEIAELEKEEELLLKSVDISIITQRKEAALFRVSRFAQEYANIMQVETGDDLIQLDTSKLTIRVIGKDGTVAWLKEIGSGANWLGYHIATLLALHELFHNQSIPYVPKLLVLDQPSQTHFPDDTDEEAEHEEFEAVKNVFKACSLAIERFEGKFQVIITDHAGGSAVKGVKYVNIVERWRQGRKLIPWHWHPEALRVCIEQESKANYALEDIKDTVLEPQLIKVLKLKDFSDLHQINIVKSLFTEDGIEFIVNVISKELKEYTINGTVHSDLSVSISKIDN